jgi:hypothetical protein
VKPTVNVKPFKVKIPIEARIGKIEEPKPVPIGIVCEGRDTASFFITNARWKERQECWVFVLAALLLKKISLFCKLEPMFQHVVSQLCKMLDTMFQHPGTVQCAWILA